jgi:amino acid adenylation domain-containing protein
VKNRSIPLTKLPPEQQAIRDKCFHPSGTFVEFPIEDVEKPIPERFEKIVRQYPQRIAIKDKEKAITYYELNGMANRVAHGLLGACGSTTEPVGLLLENAVAFIASILGVLKAGKFFIPLDPVVSLARNTACLEDAQARLLVVDNENIGTAKQLGPNGPRLVEFETFEKEASTQPVLKSPSSLMLAYIAYTSGSTGEPKGVMVDHRYLLHDVMLRTNAYHISHHDRLSLIAAASVHALNNIFFALLNGATLLPFNVRREGVLRLAEWLLRERISICRITIQLFRELCSALTGREKFQDLRLIQFAGDSRFTSDVEKWKQWFPPSCLLANGISSSETGYLTDFLIDHATTLQPEMMPAGYVVENKEVLVLDERGEQVDFNQIGELVAKSAFLSPGYWQKPGLTKTKFKFDSGADEKRTFFTGDLVLRLPDGCFVYKGRKDFRVKVRGYNVEPADIENALRQHQSIKHAGVLAWGRNEHDLYLAAYIVPEQEAPSVDDLRSFLKELLPDYMIPSAFVFLESLPLTNGKLDRKALPKPDDKRPELRTPYCVAQNELEKSLLEVWEEVLDVHPIGIHDDFFDLGGHSLLGMRILSTLNNSFGVELSMRNLLDAPTVAGLAEQCKQVGVIRGVPNSVLKQDHAIISAVREKGTLPLSYAEEGLWLNDQIRPGLSTWNMQSRLRLRGSLNVEVLKRSLDTLIQRHEVLRTAYRSVDGRPRRRVATHLLVELLMTQLDSSVATDEEIIRICSEEKKQPFELAEAPLFRTRLITVNDQDHLLVITKHHIITDAWSSRVFQRELFSLYDAYSKGQPSPLAELPLQYSDYARWVREAVRERMGHHLSFWREKLKGCVVQEIPTEKQRPLGGSYGRARECIQISKEELRALSELCTEQRATLFMLLVAAFKVLLSRYTGSSDTVVGSTLAGRSRPELEYVLGMFINILILHTDLSGQPTFRELLRRVRETCLEAYEHQDMPFEKLVEELNPSRGLNRNPFFQVLFNVASIPPSPQRVAGISVAQMPHPEDTARFDLTFYSQQTNDGLEIIAAYNHALFSRSRIREMLQQYKYFLEQIVDNPDQQIYRYSLVTESAKQLLPDPTTPLDDTWHGGVHELFAQHAYNCPSKVAIADPMGTWSYKELNDRSNQLANYLLVHGVGCEDIVAVYGRRSATLVCAVLGILKAGAAFCVIDPEHPVHRIEEYLSATGSRVFIRIGTTRRPNGEIDNLIKRFSLKCRIRLPRAKSAAAWRLFSAFLTREPGVIISPENLAYVIFTSGSTGKPKGVMGRHGPLTHFLPWLRETFQLSEKDRFSLLSSISTNKLQREIFTALCLGASLYIPDDEEIGGFGKLDHWLRANEINIIHLTPAMMQLLDDTARDTVLSIRKVFFGGDLLKMRDVSRVRKVMPNAEITNFYNSSETQRGGGYVVLTDQGLDNEKEIRSLGKGVKDVQLLILNQAGKLAGIGEQGEICVRSPHLARGYLGDDALTKERFITNPFTGIPHDRIYRTGELGRYLPDSTVEFIARAENRFSIRGFRVELGEIESAVSEHPAVGQAAIVGYQDPTEMLVAYFVAKTGQTVTVPDLRNFLRARLPRHMIPAHFIPLDSIPLTATGKVDRTALASLKRMDMESTSPYVAPRNGIERALCSVWAEILGIERVGIDDDFFDLGGHSLLAARLISRIVQSFHVELPLKALFDAPTVGTMAIEIIEHQVRKLDKEELNCMLAELEAISDEEAQRLVAERAVGERR